MTEYALYVESGPKRRKTMVHVLDLLGCNNNGPTTDYALAGAPQAIRRYLTFLRSIGEDVDPDALFETRVEAHITQGTWLGNGSPYITFEPDFAPLTDADIATLTGRFRAIRETLAAWAEAQTDEALDAPTEGRTARAILLHVLATPGAYVSPIVGAPGVSRIGTLCERSEVPLADGLRRVEAIVSQRLRESTPQQRTGVFERGQILRTLRKSVRRVLEHDWEHLVELSQRAGGPRLA